MEDIFYEWVPFIVGLFTVLVAYLFWKRSASLESEGEKVDAASNTALEEKEKEHHEEKEQKPKKKEAKHAQVKRKEVKDTYTHPWLISSLKGHSGEILDMDYSANGKLLASCANDRSVMLWTVKTFVEKNHRSIRANVEFDHATNVKWSPDGKAFIASVATANTIQVYKVGKKADGALGNVEPILKFPELHNVDIIDVGIACNGHFIMSCSADTTIVIWDLKGQKLASVDTHHINNYYACVSPCGRFIASSGFTPDVRVWEVCFSKTGDFKEVKRAFELKGHTSGVYHFSFSNDSSRMVTVSKDGTWKLWDTNIEYDKGQEPYLLKTSPHQSSSKCLTALSPDGRTVAIAETTASDVTIYSAVTGELQVHLKDIHIEPVRVLLFSPDGLYLTVATGKHIRLFHNVPGYKNKILGLEEAKKKATSATMRDRLQSEIEETRVTLKTFEES
ncbi:LOW QUALITY PROTEIN: transducin beta-like protein 2 [Uloborus diversus]|uniref:LOW QUALITY PROTEIN: transducin beta-like protein 2 n=1 Tax=Uloborus diversus TaxID=327109 RepID=UPI002409A4EF|nr:LOW QUALITY PROTEIN: transducin beta-like protein 2 [Uloborus diversus]